MITRKELEFKSSEDKVLNVITVDGKITLQAFKTYSVANLLIPPIISRENFETILKEIIIEDLENKMYGEIKKLIQETLQKSNSLSKEYPILILKILDLCKITDSASSSQPEALVSPREIPQ